MEKTMWVIIETEPQRGLPFNNIGDKTMNLWIFTTLFISIVTNLAVIIAFADIIAW